MPCQARAVVRAYATRQGCSGVIDQATAIAYADCIPLGSSRGAGGADVGEHPLAATLCVGFDGALAFRDIRHVRCVPDADRPSVFLQQRLTV